MHELPIIGISMGDPAGIGPEIIASALTRPRVHEICRPLVIGDAGVIRQATRFAGTSQTINAISNIRDAQFQRGAIDVLDLKNVDLSKLKLGEVSAMAGHAAFEAVR